MVGSGESSGKSIMLPFFSIIGFFLPLALLFKFLWFRCILRRPLFIETFKCLPFATCWRVTDPLSLTFTSCFFGAPIPFVSVPHPDAGKLPFLGFLIVGQPFGALWFCILSLLLLLWVLMLSDLRGSFKLPL